jgi:hypothetical protein
MVLPYLKGLIIIKCGFFYLALWIYCVFSICGDYIGRSIQVLNKLLDTPTTLRGGGGGVNECGDLFPKTSLLHKTH